MLYNLPLRMAPFKVEINTNYVTMKWVQYWKKVRNIIYHICNIYIKRGVDSLGCSHRCLESSEEMEAPQWCWSHCRSSLCCDAGPAERREVNVNGHVHFYAHGHLPQCSVSLCSCLSQFPLLFVRLCVKLVHDFVCACSLLVSTLPFSGRSIDWEWLSCCLTSCEGAEVWHWASALLNAIVLRVSEEAARCMLFTGVKGQWSEVEQTNRGDSNLWLITCNKCRTGTAYRPTLFFGLQIYTVY